MSYSYATRPGKGSHLALSQAIEYNNQGGYWLKLDVRKFFDTINHKVLIKQIASYFIEEEIVKAFTQIINCRSNCCNAVSSTGIGLPIGNLTSQYFANFYLSFLDRYALHELKISRYIRYMDDIVFWRNNKHDIWNDLEQLSFYLERELKQFFKPYTLNKSGYPMPFLGFLVSNTTIPNKRNRSKYKKKLIHLTQSRNLSEYEKLKRYWILHQFYNYKANTYVQRRG